MGQLRDKIRDMVRKEFTARLIKEAEGKVYRHSNYETDWSNLESGSASDQPTDEASKHDFVRWFMKSYVKSGSTLRLEGDQLNRVSAMLQAVANDPDKFIETLNKERELVFGESNFRSSADPAATVLGMYMKFKDLRGHLSNTRDFDAVKLDDAGEGEEKIYDVDKNLTSKADIARMLSSDPTETTTEMSVVNKVESALKHIGSDKIKDLLRLFKSNDATTEDRKEIRDSLTKLSKLINKGIDTYSYKFTESMIDAFDGVSEDDEEAQRRAFAVGLVEFKEAIGVRIGSQEIDVFNDVMEAPVESTDVFELVMKAAQNPDNADIYFDEILAAAREVFVDEYNKQGNFNSLGDYIDAMPEVKAVRNTLETIARRGRPAGSTKEVMAARAAAEPAPAAAPVGEPKRRGRPPKAR